MSLVGTRPPTVDEWEQYEPHHRARMAFRPGLTGLWQVSGRSNITDFEEVVKLDEVLPVFMEDNRKCVLEVFTNEQDDTTEAFEFYSYSNDASAGLKSAVKSVLGTEGTYKLKKFLGKK